MSRQVTAGQALEFVYDVFKNPGMDFKSIEIKPTVDSDEEFAHAFSFAKKLLGTTSLILEKNPEAFALALKALTVVYQDKDRPGNKGNIRVTANLMLDEFNNSKPDCLADAANLMNAMLNDSDGIEANWEAAKTFCRDNLKSLTGEQLAGFFSKSYEINVNVAGTGVLDTFIHDNTFSVAFDGIELSPMLSTLIRGTLGLPEKSLWSVSAEERPMALMEKEDYRNRLDSLVDVLNRLQGYELRAPIEGTSAIVVAQTLELLRCGHVIANSGRNDEYLSAAKVLSDVFFGPAEEALTKSKKLFKKHPGSTVWKPRIHSSRIIKSLNKTVGEWDVQGEFSQATNRARLFLLSGILGLYGSKKGDDLNTQMPNIKDFVRDNCAVLFEPGAAALDPAARRSLIDLSSAIDDPTFLPRFLEKNKSSRAHALDNALGL